MTSDSTSLYGNPANGVITRRAVQYFGLAPSLPLLGSSYLEGTALLASIGSCGGAWILSLTRSFSWSSYNLANAFFISRLMLLTPLWLTLARRSPRIAPISSISTKVVFTDVGSLGLWTFYRTPSALHPLWVHLLHCLLRRLIVPPSGRVCGECFWRASRIRALASGLAEDGFPHMWLPPGVLIFFQIFQLGGAFFLPPARCLALHLSPGDRYAAGRCGSDAIQFYNIIQLLLLFVVVSLGFYGMLPRISVISPWVYATTGEPIFWLVAPPVPADSCNRPALPDRGALAVYQLTCEIS